MFADQAVGAIIAVEAFAAVPVHRVDEVAHLVVVVGARTARIGVRAQLVATVVGVRDDVAAGVGDGEEVAHLVVFIERGEIVAIRGGLHPTQGIVGVGLRVTERVDDLGDMRRLVVFVSRHPTLPVGRGGQAVESIIGVGHPDPAGRAGVLGPVGVISDVCRALARVHDLDQAVVGIVDGSCGGAVGIGDIHAVVGPFVRIDPARLKRGPDVARDGRRVDLLGNLPAHQVIGVRHGVAERGRHLDHLAGIIKAIVGDGDRGRIDRAIRHAGFHEEIAGLVIKLGPQAAGINFGGDIADRIKLPVRDGDERRRQRAHLLLHVVAAVLTVVAVGGGEEGPAEIRRQDEPADVVVLVGGGHLLVGADAMGFQHQQIAGIKDKLVTDTARIHHGGAVAGGVVLVMRAPALGIVVIDDPSQAIGHLPGDMAIWVLDDGDALGAGIGEAGRGPGIVGGHQLAAQRIKGIGQAAPGRRSLDDIAPHVEGPGRKLIRRIGDRGQATQGVVGHPGNVVIAPSVALFADVAVGVVYEGLVNDPGISARAGRLFDPHRTALGIVDRAGRTAEGIGRLDHVADGIIDKGLLDIRCGAATQPGERDKAVLRVEHEVRSIRRAPRINRRNHVTSRIPDVAGDRFTRALARQTERLVDRLEEAGRRVIVEDRHAPLVSDRPDMAGRIVSVVRHVTTGVGPRQEPAHAVVGARFEIMLASLAGEWAFHLHQVAHRVVRPAGHKSSVDRLTHPAAHAVVGVAVDAHFAGGPISLRQGGDVALGVVFIRRKIAGCIRRQLHAIALVIVVL